MTIGYRVIGLFIFIVFLSFGNMLLSKNVLSCDECKIAPPDINASEIVYLNSKELMKRAKYIAPLNDPKYALSKIKDKTVVVKIFINKEGKVIKSKATKGHPLLRAGGEQAARSSTFEPITIDGKPAYICGDITMEWNPDK
jgi:hypothetical protein